jgi:hypothetical protein
MSEPARKPDLAQYEGDFFAWTEEQGRLLRARKAAGLDWENLAEEIETLGRSERGEIRSRLTVILLHLLKWQFQPTGRNASWRATLLEQRDQLNDVLKDSPSLKGYPETVLPKQYSIARMKAAGETELPLDRFPLECPYAISEILDEEFHPDEPR